MKKCFKIESTGKDKHWLVPRLQFIYLYILLFLGGFIMMNSFEKEEKIAQQMILHVLEENKDLKEKIESFPDKDNFMKELIF